MQKRILFFVAILCFFQVPVILAQSPKTDTIPSLPPESEVKIDRDTTSWLNDTTSLKKRHSPRKATLYSTVLPGLGQVYNRQYYKVPILAAAGILLATQISSNNFDLKQANGNLNTRLINDQYPASIKATLPSDQYDAYDESNPDFKNSGFRKYSTNDLRNLRDAYRRDRDFYVILSVLVYALNIVDAAVFAHLREFEVTDKLTLKLDPDIRFVTGNFIPLTGLIVSFNVVKKKNTL